MYNGTTTRTVVTTVHRSAPPPPVVPICSSPCTQQGNSPSSAISPFNNLKVKSFEITFDRRRNLGQSLLMPDIFYTGEMLEGSVNLNIIKPLKALRITLNVVSEVKLGNQTKTIVHEEKILFGSRGGKSHSTLNKGEHKFDFSVHLPEGLLPSVETKSNFVKYKCKAEIVRILSKNSIRIEKDFAVYQDNPNTANSLLENGQPVEVEWDVDSKLRVSYQINKTGFAIGETPVVVGEIFNFGRSNASVKICLDVIRTIKINGTINLGVKIFYKDEHTIEGQGIWSQTISVEPNGQMPFSLELNFGQPPPTTHCENIEIFHKLRVKVLKEKNGFSLSKAKPLIKEHDVIITKPNRQAGIARGTSKISLGRNSLKRTKRTPSRQSSGSVLGGSFSASPELPPSYSEIACN